MTDYEKRTIELVRCLSHDGRAQADRLHIKFLEQQGIPTWQPGTKAEQKKGERIWGIIVREIFAREAIIHAVAALGVYAGQPHDITIEPIDSPDGSHFQVVMTLLGMVFTITANKKG